MEMLCPGCTNLALVLLPSCQGQPTRHFVWGKSFTEGQYCHALAAAVPLAPHRWYTDVSPTMASHRKATGQLQSVTWYIIVVQGFDAYRRDVDHIIKGKFDIFSWRCGSTKIREEKEVQEQCFLFSAGGGELCAMLGLPLVATGPALAQLSQPWPAVCPLLSWHRGQVWAQITSGISFCSSPDGRGACTLCRCRCWVSANHHIKTLQWSDLEFYIATDLNCRKIGMCRLGF